MAARLFIFYQHHQTDTSFYSLVINDNADMTVPYAKRPLSELSEQLKTSDVIVVLPATLVTSRLVQLPTLKNAALTIPNILEDDIGQNLDEVHFAYLTTPVKETSYLVNLVEKNVLQSVIDTFSDANIDIDVITNDFILFNENTICLGNQLAYIQQDDDLGVIGLAQREVLAPTDTVKYVTFNDTPHEHLVSSTDITKEPLNYHEYFASQYNQYPHVNLRQGSFEKKERHKRSLIVVTAISLLIAILTISANGLVRYHQTKTRLASLKEKTFMLYQEFFPNASAMVSPKFRIESLLKSHGQDKSSQRFFSLLSHLNESLESFSGITVTELSYQNDRLTLRIRSNQFDTLLKWRQHLEQKSVKVQQLSAESKDSFVLARWSLSL